MRITFRLHTSQGTKVLEELKVKIGLEIHARILSKTKIFSDANCFDISTTPINSSVSFFDAALPGTMPTMNRRCAEAALLTALALNCRINSVSNFERKHYFYSDLPAGYQITQQRQPIALNGSLKYPVIDPRSQKLYYKTADITQIQLELDSARSLNTDDLSLKLNENQNLPNNSTLVDLNRAGMGLMEIVTEPCFESAFDAYSFARELALLLRSIGTCHSLMGEGGFRVDVNVSVHKTDKNTNQILPGTRVELKNLSSFNSVLKATEYEIKRQKNLASTDKKVQKETRTFDSKSGQTVAIRSKEDQYDYRFMPEPNLLPLVVYPARTFSPVESTTTCNNNQQLIFNQEFVRRMMNERVKPEFFVDLDKVKDIFESKDLPQKRRDYLIERFGMKNELAFVFVANNLDRILIEVVGRGVETMRMDENRVKSIVSVLNFEFLNQVNTNPKFEGIDFMLKCDKVEEYSDLMSKGLVSRRLKYQFFAKIFEENNLKKTAFQVAEENNYFLVNDRGVIEKVLVDELFVENQKALEQYKSKPKKREKLVEYFVRVLHLRFEDRADPDIVNSVVNESLSKLVKG